MKKIKYYLTYDEQQLIIYALNNFRNSLIAKDEYTDTVNDALLAVMRGKVKKVKVA
ncbi:MAG: hypothetical protein LBL36_00790 [Clostridiales Family XIII bacterium]|jgi:hypothetical protein|nr:hypothetical protein [Clostridiales Family XIII bacterium]